MVVEHKNFSFAYKAYDSAKELPQGDKDLLAAAHDVVHNAYAPYSNFRVGVAILLANGEVVTGTNQENASYPVGICAEGTALGSASSQYPEQAILKMAITAKSANHLVAKPVAPCGLCRQRILEYETRYNQPIELILQGEEGNVYVIDTVKHLLPLYFSGSDI
jgi:cytidine deaminase